MARKPDIQYVRFYTGGSAARQVEPKTPSHPRKAKTPSPRKQQEVRVFVDPVAIGGIIMAVVMLVLLAAGVIGLVNSYTEAGQMEQYVAYLEEENRQLQNTYASGYDLEAVEELALALGMVPADQVEQIPITVTVPQAPQEPTLWERICDFFAGLFA